jgi:hypothetical protein
VVGAVLIATVGLGLLYYPNADFGSTGDYLGIALWSVVLTGMLRGFRRLLPWSDDLE